MWRKYYEIAERQHLAGKWKTVESHALKALQFAKESNDDIQIAKSMWQLSRLYMDRDYPQALETLKESIERAQKAYGADSPEVAEQISLLSVILEEKDDLEEAEKLKLKAISIYEKSPDDTAELLETMYELLEIYVPAQKWAEADSLLHRIVYLQKSILGWFYENLNNDLESYAVILKGLCKEDEAEKLRTLVSRASLEENTLFPYLPRYFLENMLQFKRDDDQAERIPSKNKDTVNGAAEVDGEVKEIGDGDDEPDGLDNYIQELRGVVETLTPAAQRQIEALHQDDPFIEFKTRALRVPCQWAQSNLAEMLRLKKASPESMPLLLEAAAIFKDLLEECPGDFRTQLLMMYTLCDVAIVDPSACEALQTVLALLPDSVSKCHINAWFRFLQHGDSPQSRDALKEAMSFNREFRMLAGEVADLQTTTSIEPGSKEEFQLLNWEAQYHWAKVPGAFDFYEKELIKTLPRHVRQRLAKAEER